VPQLFPPVANVLARWSLAALLVFLGAGAWAWTAFTRSDYLTRVNHAPAQPVPFSHQHHVGRIGIDCRYCHASVADSAFAGLPPTHTCMSCHSQLWRDAPMLDPVRRSLAAGVPLRWIRVYDLPDFVYFDHSVHVRQGIGCTTCHGPVGEMPLTRKVADLSMRWCLNCHAKPERYVRPREEVFNPDYTPPADQQALGARLVREYGIQRRIDCSTCHR